MSDICAEIKSLRLMTPIKHDACHMTHVIPVTFDISDILPHNIKDIVHKRYLIIMRDNRNETENI